MYKFKTINMGKIILGIMVMTCALMVFSTIRAQANTYDLLGYWNFDDVEDTIVPDESGNGLEGILSDQPVGGLDDYPFEEINVVENVPCGKAVFLNGQTSTMIVNDFDGYSEAFTIEVWFKMKSRTVSYLLVQYNNPQNPNMVLQSFAGKLHFSVKGEEGTLEIQSDSEIILDNWYHLAITLGDGQMKMYLNGNLESVVEVFDSVSRDAGALKLALYYPGWRAFSGWMDELRIYNRTLTKEEVQDDMDYCHPEEYDATHHSLTGIIKGNLQKGITVELSGDFTATTTTNEKGEFSFSELSDGFYTITPWSEKCSFTPPLQQVTLDRLNNIQLIFEAAYTGNESLGLKLWEFTPENPMSTISAPTVSGDKVFQGFLDGNIYCLNKENGKELWTASVRSPEDQVVIGAKETIADERRVYITCAGYGDLSYTFLSPEGKVVCLNKDNGNLIWENPIGHAESLLALYKDNLYVIGGNWRENKTGLYCLNLETGNTIWQYPTEKYLEAGPSIYRNKVYFTDYTLGNVYCINAETGEECWVAPGLTSNTPYGPALSKGRLYIGGGKNKKIYCLDAETGKEVWSFPHDGYGQSSPAVDGGKVYFGSFDKYIYCLDAETGQQVWKFETDGNILNHNTSFYTFPSPAIVQGRVYIGTWDNRLYCLDGETGEKIWSYDLRKRPYSCVINRGKTFLGGGATIFCLNAGTEEVDGWPMFQKNFYRTGCTSVISGKIVDENGEPLSGVQLTASGRKGLNLTTVTTSSNDRGFYEFAELPEGTFTVKASAQGYGVVSEKVTLNPLTPIDDLDFILKSSICPATLALGVDSNDLITLRIFRDEILSKTPEGQEIIKLYYDWSPAIVDVMLEDEEFEKEVKAIIEEILPMIKELVEKISFLKKREHAPTKGSFLTGQVYEKYH